MPDGCLDCVQYIDKMQQRVPKSLRYNTFSHMSGLSKNIREIMKELAAEKKKKREKQNGNHV